MDNTRNVDFHVMPDEFIEGLPAGAKIVKFLGCGSGRDTKYFLEHGYRVDAIDGSAELCALASEYIGDSGEMPVVPRAGCIGSANI